MEGIIKSDLLKADLENFRDLFSKLKGYPIRGELQNPGVGINIDLDDGSQIGWVKYYSDLFQNTVTSDWCHIVDSQMEADILNPDLQANVSPAELTTIQSMILTKVTLDSNWFPSNE